MAVIAIVDANAIFLFLPICTKACFIIYINLRIFAALSSLFYEPFHFFTLFFRSRLCKCHLKKHLLSFLVRKPLYHVRIA